MRIGNSRIRDDFTEGQVYRAQDVNTLIQVLKDGINLNFETIKNLVVSGQDHVRFRQPYEEEVPYSEILKDSEGLNGDYGAIFDHVENHIVIFKKENDNWQLLYEDVNLKTLLNKFEEVIKAERSIPDIVLGVVEVFTNQTPFYGLRNIDGYQLQNGDSVGVIGKGEEVDGIYSVSAGSDWIKKMDIEHNQIISVKYGEEYGGTMIKRLEDSSALMVKAQEKPMWKIIT